MGNDDDYIRGRALFYRGKDLPEDFSAAMFNGWRDAYALHVRVAQELFG